MSDAKSIVRRWEDMEMDVLVKIFRELNMIELSPVSQVCRQWRLASSDSLLWSTLDLGLLKSNFIQTRASPFVWVDERSDRKLTRVLRISMALSHRNITCLIFHFNLYMRDEHLSYIAERCPHIKRLILPAWNRITKSGICQAIRRWQHLESLTMPNIAHPPYIMEEISRNCKNFTQLKVMGPFDINFAKAITDNICNLRVLSIRCSLVSRPALLHVLDYMDKLEVLNISHCIILEGSNPSKPVLRKLDKVILNKAERLREFFHCQSNLCPTCRRMIDDEGYMRWWKYEELFWRMDEVSSLDLGYYGRLFDEGCSNQSLLHDQLL